MNDSVKTCSDCGIKKPLDCFYKRGDGKPGVQYICKVCSLRRNLRWQKSNPAKRRIVESRWRLKHAQQYSEQLRRYRAANHEKINEKARAKYAANPAKSRAKKNKQYASNLERSRQNARKLYLVNHGKEMERARKYRATHPQACRDAARRRRVHMRHVFGRHTFEEFRQICLSYGNKCLCCGRSYLPSQLTRDHVIPITKEGATDFISNIQPLCGSCNARKGQKTIDYRPALRIA